MHHFIDVNKMIKQLFVYLEFIIYLCTYKKFALRGGDYAL